MTNWSVMRLTHVSVSLWCSSHNNLIICKAHDALRLRYAMKEKGRNPLWIPEVFL
jgi:hypothetical protein